MTKPLVATASAVLATLVLAVPASATTAPLTPQGDIAATEEGQALAGHIYSLESTARCKKVTQKKRVKVKTKKGKKTKTKVVRTVVCKKTAVSEQQAEDSQRLFDDNSAALETLVNTRSEDRQGEANDWLADRSEDLTTAIEQKFEDKQTEATRAYDDKVAYLDTIFEQRRNAVDWTHRQLSAETSSGTIAYARAQCGSLFTNPPNVAKPKAPKAPAKPKAKKGKKVTAKQKKAYASAKKSYSAKNKAYNADLAEYEDWREDEGEYQDAMEDCTADAQAELADRWLEAVSTALDREYERTTEDYGLVRDRDISEAEREQAKALRTVERQAATDERDTNRLIEKLDRADARFLENLRTRGQRALDALSVAGA